MNVNEQLERGEIRKALHHLKAGNLMRQWTWAAYRISGFDHAAAMLRAWGAPI